MVRLSAMAACALQFLSTGQRRTLQPPGDEPRWHAQSTIQLSIAWTSMALSRSTRPVAASGLGAPSATAVQGRGTRDDGGESVEGLEWRLRRIGLRVRGGEAAGWVSALSWGRLTRRRPTHTRTRKLGSPLTPGIHPPPCVTSVTAHARAHRVVPHARRRFAQERVARQAQPPSPFPWPSPRPGCAPYLR